MIDYGREPGMMPPQWQIRVIADTFVPADEVTLQSARWTAKYKFFNVHLNHKTGLNEAFYQFSSVEVMEVTK